MQRIDSELQEYIDPERTTDPPYGGGGLQI